MPRRIVLTALEMEAILSVAGNALAEETFSGDPDLDETQRRVLIAAYNTGMDKLRTMLARRARRLGRRS